jgi:hypothetical protein
MIVRFRCDGRGGGCESRGGGDGFLDTVHLDGDLPLLS